MGPGVHFNGAAPGPLFRSLPTECTRIAIVELLTSSGTLIQHNQVENSLHTEAVSIQAKRCSGCVWAGYGCHSCFDCRSDSSRNSVLSIRSIQTFRTNAFLDLSCDSDRMLDLLSSVLKNSQSSWDYQVPRRAPLLWHQCDGCGGRDASRVLPSLCKEVAREGRSVRNPHVKLQLAQGR